MSRELVTIGEHTIDVSLLTRGGCVLDAGCRDFTFAKGINKRGCLVAAIDADPTIEDPEHVGITYINRALAATEGRVYLAMTPDPQARYITSKPLIGADSRSVWAHSIVSLSSHMGVEQWEVVKLDIEGAEYEILQQWPGGSIAKQISVEFHEHVRPRPQRIYDAIFKHLDQWYTVIQHEKTARHCCAANYWDTLLIRKDLV